MQGTTYGIKIAVALPWGAAVARTTEALKAEGFGVAVEADARLRRALHSIETQVPVTNA